MGLGRRLVAGSLRARWPHGRLVLLPPAPLSGSGGLGGAAFAKPIASGWPSEWHGWRFRPRPILAGLSSMPSVLALRVRVRGRREARSRNRGRAPPARTPGRRGGVAGIDPAVPSVHDARGARVVRRKPRCQHQPGHGPVSQTGYAVLFGRGDPSRDAVAILPLGRFEGHRLARDRRPVHTKDPAEQVLVLMSPPNMIASRPYLPSQFGLREHLHRDVPWMGQPRSACSTSAE